MSQIESNQPLSMEDKITLYRDMLEKIKIELTTDTAHAVQLLNLLISQVVVTSKNLRETDRQAPDYDARRAELAQQNLLDIGRQCLELQGVPPEIIAKAFRVMQ
jgi:predicted solute-binding protein